MKCPHCHTSIHSNPITMNLGSDHLGAWLASRQNCPACEKLFVEIIGAATIRNTERGPQPFNQFSSYFAIPRNSVRHPPTKGVPNSLLEDYHEAAAILDISPKASAAISRRCLQYILRENADVKHSNLANEIQQVMDSSSLPSHICEAIDAIRNIGNFSAHPSKSKSTGEVVQVEKGEAEWNLDVLDALFDFYFAQPEFIKERREALNEKLKDMGKPEMK